MSNMFTGPAATGDGWDLNTAVGHLLVIEPHVHETGIVTSLGERDAVRATVHDITAAATLDDVLIFPKVMVAALKTRVGTKVLGTLGQGVAKPGQKPPWLLFDASGDPDAVAKASAYLTGQVAATLTPPAAAPAAAGKVDLTGKTPEQVAALKSMGLA